MSIFTKAFNKLGHESLAERFPGGAQPQGQGWENRCVQFGSVRYDWCVTIVVAREGLWLQARPPLQGVQRPIFVPWAEIHEARSTLLYWRQATRLICGRPPVGTVTVWRPVWDEAAPLWQAARAGDAARSADAPPEAGGRSGAPPA